MGVLARVVSGATWRAYVHLLLGAVVALPYVAVTWLFKTSFAAGLDPLGGALLVAVAVAAGVGVALVPGLRALEIAAARALLDADLPEPSPGRSVSWADRRRSAMWLLVVVAAGSVAALVTLAVVPLAVGLVIAPWHRFDPVPGGWAGAWAPIAGVALPGALLFAVSATGKGLRRFAPGLLGPSAAERLDLLAAELQEARTQERAAAERARLAGELHDSIGHALTVTIVQAGAAARVLDSRPEFVRAALDAIADTGRVALADLDHVLGLLREAGTSGTARPAVGLADLPDLVARVRSAGIDVVTDLDGNLAAVPGAVSRAAYRVVQESLTNAARHAAGAPVTARVAITGDEVEIDVRNPVQAASGPTSAGGRGVAGLRERVGALGGVVEAGERDGVWRVHARLPLAR